MGSEPKSWLMEGRVRWYVGWGVGLLGKKRGVGDIVASGDKISRGHEMKEGVLG
jgi:hypothetical protein